MVVDELQRNGVDTEIIHVGHKDIRDCIGCYKCRELDFLHGEMPVVARAIRAERERNGLPEQEPQRIATNFIR